MAKGWRKFNKVKVLTSIKGSAGIKGVICQRLGCDRQTFDNYLAEDEKILAAYNAEIDELGDVVEAKIIEAIKNGSETMAIYYSKTKLKHRGYVERTEVDNIRPIILKVDKDDAQA